MDVSHQNLNTSSDLLENEISLFKKHKLVPNFMEQSCFWEAHSCSGSQVI
jgi:hypothetical protein